jgi:5-methylcytosine-specific restriction protein B
MTEPLPGETLMPGLLGRKSDPHRDLEVDPMTDSKSNRFIKYFALLLDALRSTHPAPMRPAEARAWIRSKIEVPVDDLTRLIENGKQSIFENDVHWARFYLAKANLIGSPKRGLWGLTPEGVNTRLTPDETWALYVRVRDANRPGDTTDEDKIPAPDTADDGEDRETYWFAGALWDKTDDQMPRFLADGIWENGYEDQFTELVRSMKPGDRIAIKASFVQKRGLPFDVGGKSVSVRRIKATGTVLTNLHDGKTVRVAWDPPFAPRDWYFYTYRTTVVEADPESEGARRLVDFTFRGIPQDYAYFLSQPYWVQKYGVRSDSTIRVPESSEIEEREIFEADDEPTYTVDDIIAEGSFLDAEELQRILG